MSAAERLSALRAELDRQGWDGFLVPRSDEHQGEYVPPSAERLAWLTGFTGSAGLAAVLRDAAAIFVDGRYTLQVRDQVDSDLYDPRHVTDEPLSDWLRKALPKGARLAFDPWLHTPAQVARLRRWTEAAGGELVAADSNPLDAVWQDRPAPPRAPVREHPMEYAGRSSRDKRQDLAAKLKDKGIEVAFLSAPDSIAWLLNVRGGDVPHTPLPLSFALFHDDGRVDWFIDPKKLSAGSVPHLDNRVHRHGPDALAERLDGLRGRKVLLDPDSAPEWVSARLRQAEAPCVEGPDPCLLPKAKKNEVEIDGARAAHRRDGQALCRFLTWFDDLAARLGEGESLDELRIVDRLSQFRQEDPMFRDLSFDTIAGSGPNGAIVHYRVTPQSNRALALGELFLLDSGAQYPDGTTDVTRTLAVGEPSAEMRRCFTLVLKGHIAIAGARFPKGTTGSQLDSLARYPLWQEGFDYDHGTGHGVGSYLGVHEGPQRISKLPNSTPLEPGMIVSNEPGYYRVGAFGIRIENLVCVIEASDVPQDERAMLAFETLTLAPIDLRLVEPALLTAGERAWLNAYHQRVRETHIEALGEAERGWLEQATRAC
jgi:Xaa-Pro aminopeptidase